MPRDDDRLMVCFTKNCSPYRAGERAAFPPHKAAKLVSTGVGYIEGIGTPSDTAASVVVPDAAKASNVVDWPEDPGEPQNPKFRKQEAKSEDDNDDSESNDEDGDGNDGDEGTASEPEPEAKPRKAKKSKTGKPKKRRTKLSE